MKEEEQKPSPEPSGSDDDFLAGAEPAAWNDEDIQRGSACGEGGCE